MKSMDQADAIGESDGHRWLHGKVGAVRNDALDAIVYGLNDLRVIAFRENCLSHAWIILGKD